MIFSFCKKVKLLSGFVLAFVMAHLVANVQNKMPPCSYTSIGFITDDHDGIPLEIATIYIVELKKGGVSDSNGIFF